MKAELVPLNGDPPIPITRDVTVVGRREFCDVRIDHPSLSKRHCVLVRTDGLLMLRDLVTTNGTKVNGQRVMWAALLPNDRLTLGGYKMQVYLGPDDAPSPSEQAAGAGAPLAAVSNSASSLLSPMKSGFPPPTPDPERVSPSAGLPPRPKGAVAPRRAPAPNPDEVIQHDEGDLLRFGDPLHDDDDQPIDLD